MKMILQKHTSKFVANLLNGLGIIACVSLTSCGDKNKGKQTEKQGENLKNELKNVEFYKNLADDEDSLKAIADWLNNKNYGSDHILTENELKEIFQNDSSKLNEVAEKLGLELTESDSNRDDENQKSEITLKIEGKGKVIITKVAGNTKTDFVFGEIKNLQSFVENLKDKEITKVEGELSFVFEGKNVKICGHETGFKVTDCFGVFLNCFNTLVGFEKLNVPKLSFKVTGEGVSLNDVACNDEFYKGSGFWNLVKDHAALFGITDQFEVEKNGTDPNFVVKINGFESSLKWSEVVESENTFKEDSGWKNIFKIKNEKPKTEVKIEWDVKEGYKLGDDKSFTKINNLGTLGKLVDDLKDKIVTEFKGDFILNFNGKNVNICGGDEIDITSDSNFKTLLGYVKTLRDTNKVISSKFEIKIASSKKGIMLNNIGMNQNFIKTANFWDAVNTYKELFKNLPVTVEKDETESSKKGKIGKTVINVEMFSGEDIAQEWKEIFKKK